MFESLKTVELNTAQSVLKVNGTKLPAVDYFRLCFDGAWHITFQANFRVHGVKASFVRSDQLAISETERCLTKQELPYREPLESAYVDIEHGIVKINGVQLPGVTEFDMEYSGKWIATVVPVFRYKK